MLAVHSGASVQLLGLLAPLVVNIVPAPVAICIPADGGYSPASLVGTFVPASRPLFPEVLIVITPAFAQSASPLGGSDMLIQIVPFILIFVVMYFLVMRPQQKRAKTHQEMIKNVRRGDQIVMTGGLIGKVVKVTDDAELELEIADGVRVRVARGMIAEVRSKSEPVKS